MAKRGFLIIDPQRNMLEVDSAIMSELLNHIRNKEAYDDPLYHVVKCTTKKQLIDKISVYLKGGDIEDEKNDGWIH